MLCFFTTSAFLLKAFTLSIGVLICNFEKWKKQLRKGLPGFNRRKIAKKKFLCSNVENLKVLSGLLMFSEMGQLRSRKNLFYLSRGVCSKIMMFTPCSLEEMLEDLIRGFDYAELRIMITNV